MPACLCPDGATRKTFAEVFQWNHDFHTQTIGELFPEIETWFPGEDVMKEEKKIQEFNYQHC